MAEITTPAGACRILSFPPMRHNQPLRQVAATVAMKHGPARIIAFPIIRQISFIRQAAAIVAARNGGAADRFWSTTCRRLFGRMQCQGVAIEDINSEIQRFTQAVQAELQRLQWLRQNTGSPGDAA